MIWSHVVELLRAVIFTVAHVCNGSLGAAVFVVSLLLRLALMPITMRLARHARRQAALMAAMQPELERLKARYANDPAALLRETLALQRRHGYRMLDPASLLGGLVQMPVLGALFGALRGGFAKGVRFLWIADLSRRNVVLAGILALATYLGMTSSASGDPTKPAPVMLGLAAAALTLVFLLSSSSAVAVSFGASSVVSALQSWLLRRDARRAAASGAVAKA